MHNLVRSWHHTLIDGGCEKLLHTGVYGLHQAVLRSIGSFYVSYDHISFNYPHDSLYRDIVFRRIQLNKPGIYANFEIRLLSREGSISSPHLMAVELSVWRSPSLSVLLSTSLYNHLSKDMFTRLIVPFTISIPPTALMYLGSELKDLIKYSQTLHFVEVYAGPAPKHDIITMHRHGHVFGGLPWLFWISLVLLIAIFHMFFCKIIYNELRNKNQMSIPRDSWRLPRYASDLISSTAFETRGISNTQISRRRITDLDTIP
ncbi:hypothetical protein KSF78_0007777 [Schistosoma japonicum]|nr:hypothetical protein KSF78_0007777 [Schistosoma japonicum]